MSFFANLLKFGAVLSKRDPVTGGIRKLSANGQAIPIRLGLESISVGVLGDSISAQGFDEATAISATAGDPTLNSRGWVTWWQAFSRANINFTKYAVSGSKTSDVLSSQLTAALAAKHDIYTLCPIGINDDVTGDESVSNINAIAEAIVNAGARMILGTPTPNADFGTSAPRITTIMAGMRALAIKYPAQIRLVDISIFVADPNSSAGNTFTTAFDKVTYDGTHPTWAMAQQIGAAVHKATAEWTAPYVFPIGRGDQKNLLPNGRFGGTAGTITNAGTNSVAPDGWTASRGGASVTYSMFKARRLPLMWKTVTTFPVGARIVPAVPSGYHYIVLTSAPTGATAPSATTAFGQSTPDVGGPVYLTVPANDAFDMPEIGEDVLLLGASTGVTSADHCGMSNVAIDVTAHAGKTVKIGMFVESIGQISPVVTLRADQHNSGGTRLSGAWGMAAISRTGDTNNPYAAMGRNKKILVVTPAFTFDAACTQLRLYIRAYQPGASYQTAVLLSDAFMVEV